MVNFLKQVEGIMHDEDLVLKRNYESDAASYFKNFIEGMMLEGSYGVKIPCYNKNLVNPTSPNECLKGSPWVTQAQGMMGGTISDVGVDLYTSDNFHRVYVVTPHHLP